MSAPKFCRDCKHLIDMGSCYDDYSLKCGHGEVVKRDFMALASPKHDGEYCYRQRAKPWFTFPACGKAGKLYEAK